MTDLREDPYLPYVLVLAAALASFWFWHRIPNFATRDEKSRLFDSMVAYGRVIAEPSFESLKAGIVWSRVPFGATFYLFGLALLPVVLVAALVGELGAFANLGFPSYEFGFYPAWQSMPRWVWTWSLVFVRLFNIAFAVGCVYLTYRLGVATRDRATGNLAALLLTFSFGFLTIAHEGGEDMPALFFVLLALYLVVRYVQTDDRTLFLAGSAAGGAAIAFKLTAAPVILLIGLAYFLRVRRAGSEWRGALFRPGLVVGGAALGLLTIVLGFPTALVAGPEPFIERVFGGSAARASHATGPDAPIWWWFLRGYFSGLSLPLFFAGVAGVVGSVLTLRRGDGDFDAELLVLVGLAAYVLLFSQWHDFRVHHLLPTFPLIMVLLAGSLLRYNDRRPGLARPAIAVLLVTSGTYAVVGDMGYAAMPRDQAEDWLAENAPENATMEVYRRDFQDAAVPFWMNINHAYGREGRGEELVDCPQYIQLGYRDLLYLNEGTYYRNGAAQAQYITNLLRGEYNYEVVAAFGPAPERYVPERATPGSVTDLLRYGVIPQTDQYADEQELAANQYTVILERTGECVYDRNPPF